MKISINILISRANNKLKEELVMQTHKIFVANLQVREDVHFNFNRTTNNAT